MTTPPMPGSSPATSAADLRITENQPVTVRTIVYCFLGLSIPLTILVLCAMAASGASATGGCGGG
jgi:hypothetical protein